MTAATRSSIDSILKRMWGPRGIQNVIYEKSPLYGMLKKNNSYGGDALKVPVDIAPTAGRSRGFAEALANQAPSTGVAFLISGDLPTNYSFFGITTQAMRTAKSNSDAFVNALARESKRAMTAMAMSLNHSLFSGVGSSIGRILSGGGTDTLVLYNRDDAIHFYVGQQLVSHHTDGSAGTDDGEAIAVESVDHATGTITLVAATSGGHFANDDYLFVEGDTGAGLHGLSSWLPATRPTTSDSFFTVNRSVNATGLAGVLYTASPSTDGTIESTLINTSIEVGIHGGMPGVCFVSSRMFGKLIGELGAKTHYERMPARDSSGKEATKVGYQGVKVHTDVGECIVMSDRNCPLETGYMLDMDSWFLLSAGEPVGWLDEDGNHGLRSSTFDGVEFRIGGYSELVCDAPGRNARIDFSGLKLF